MAKLRPLPFLAAICLLAAAAPACARGEKASMPVYTPQSKWAGTPASVNTVIVPQNESAGTKKPFDPNEYERSAARQAGVRAGESAYFDEAANEPLRAMECRWVINIGAQGFLVPFRTPEEWTQFILNPPMEAELSTCCRPATGLSICGKTVDITDYGQDGHVYDLANDLGRRSFLCQGESWVPQGESCFTFAWKADDFPACGNVASVTRTVQCLNNEGGAAPDAYCTDAKPAETRTCTFAWQADPFPACDGAESVTRAVTCRNEQGGVAPDAFCTEPKPETTQQCTKTIFLSGNNVSLLNAAISQGWTGGGVKAVVNPGVVIGSTSTDVPALDIGGFPAGTPITLENHGWIIGKGGAGGTGGYNHDGWCQGSCYNVPGTDGGAGGPGLQLRQDVTIDNQGVIAGGGGGGGGGGFSINEPAGLAGLFCAGGGGGGGAGYGSAGAGGYNDWSPLRPSQFLNGSNGGAGGYHDGGSGGPGGCGFPVGGDGGGPGQPGAPGEYRWNRSNAPWYEPKPGGAGGPPGAAIVNAGYATWIRTGSIYGTIY